MRGIRSLLSWILALLVIGMFAFLADKKLFSYPSQFDAVFAALAENSGFEMFEPTGRFVTGIVELVAALFLFLPFTRRFGAFIAFCVSAIAVGLHMSPWLGTEAPLTAGAAETDGGMLFYLAMALTAASGIILMVHPGRRRRRF